jgi:predicted alpha/beta superfamily hydrolase
MSADGGAPTPLVFGETLQIRSDVLGETRPVHVFIPTIYGEKIDGPLPVLYLLDGGPHEDLLHVAGLVQVLSSNGGMRPAMVVGVENTNRRRDLTGPTDSPGDRRIAPQAGGSAAFRNFLRTELIPAIHARYRVTEERAIVGESLAGLFVLETFLREPDLFDAYVAVDPSLWWADGALVRDAPAAMKAMQTNRPKRVFLAWSSEPTIAAPAARFARHAEVNLNPGVTFTSRRFADEQHGSIFHPALLPALPAVFPPNKP